MAQTLPPAQPGYILRGHSAQIHSTTFIRSNSRLVTGDADGWVVVWGLATKRAVAVWKAHEGAILSSAEWGQNRLITHGKDNKLIVWKFSAGDESLMSTALPVDDSTSPRALPWLQHILYVNTLNFCAFAHCQAQETSEALVNKNNDTREAVDELLIVVPNTMSDENVDMFHLPSARRIDTISGDKSLNTGMVMAVRLFYQDKSLTLVVGFESGHTMVTQRVDGRGWTILYMSQPHTQPILSLDIAPNNDFYYTSSADAIVAKHPIPAGPRASLAVPKTTSASSSNLARNSPPAGISLLSNRLGYGSKENEGSKPIEVQRTPMKIVQTKHSGQQSLQIRSDSKIFATAGWDTKVRVYSVQTMKELAVLKWHKEGCFSVAFATIFDDNEGKVQKEIEDDKTVGKELVPRLMAMTVKEKRIFKSTTAHWLAAGSKDGKVSLWEIY